MRFSLIISILITLFIWMNSLLPASVSSAQSGFIVGIADNLLSCVGIHLDVDTLHIIIRKFAHFFEFFILGISLTIYMIKEEKNIYHVIWIGLFVALIDESIQFFINGRAASIFDVMLDFIGVCIGTLGVRILCIKKL